MSRSRGSRRSAAPLPWFDGPRPRVLAHRGLALKAPENTLLAFLHALAIGVQYLETDVHASIDGIAVLSHDPDLERLVGRPTKVNELTMAELKQLDLGEGQTFSSLADALEAFPDARFNIDIKSPDAVLPTVQAVIAAGAAERVLVTSFNGQRRRTALRLLPNVATSLSAPSFVVALLAAKLGLLPVLRLALRGADAVQVPQRALGMAITTPTLIRRMQAAGVEVHVWTINDVGVMKRLLDLGVDGLVTDRADLAIELVEARQAENGSNSG